MCSCILWTSLQSPSVGDLASCSSLQLSQQLLSSTAADTTLLSHFTGCVQHREGSISHQQWHCLKKTFIDFNETNAL